MEEYEAGYKKGKRDAKKAAVSLLKVKLTNIITRRAKGDNIDMPDDLLLAEIAGLIGEIETI
jgi:hypothetical protein